MPDLPNRRFTKSQQGSLDDIPGKLDDILTGYEKIRKAYEAQKALDPNTPTNPLVLQGPLLKDKFREFVVAVVRLWVNINQSLRLDQFRDQLESDARDFKKWLSEELRRRIHKDHLPFLDWAAIEKAVDGEVAYWVEEKQRSIPVPRPWEAPDGNDIQKAKAAAGATEASGTPAGWQDIKMSFLDERNVQTKIGQRMAEPVNYAVMGFVDGRKKGAPNLAWATLLRLAENGGEISTAKLMGKPREKLETRIKEIRDRLRKYFRLEGDPVPFVPSRESLGYRAAFKIGVSASYGAVSRETADTSL
jgi:hypothetical protein